MELTVNGKRVHAATGGRDFDPALPAVVFVHGAGMDHTVWALQARYFAHRGRAVLAVDLPGHGGSEGGSLDSIAAMGDWLAAVIEAAGSERAALVGHSMGSLAALDCAARHGGRVRALALLGSAVKMAVHPDLLAAAEANDPSAWEAITAWGYSRAAQFGLDKAPGLWMVGGAVRLLERAAPGVLYRDLRACDSYDSAGDLVSQVCCPVRLILGQSDRMTPPRGGHALAQLFPAATTIVLPACGHMMMAEQPDAVLDALIGFV